MAPSGSYPSKTVHFVSAAPPPGGWYQLCEYTIKALKEERLVPVELEMLQVSGALNVLEDAATKQRGDVYTLIAFSPGLTLQILMKGSKYSYKDVTPIAATSTDYGVLVVDKDSPIKDLKDLVNRIAREPQKVSVSGGSPPGMMHHGMIASVAAAANLAPSKVNYVGSKGVPEAMSALLSGQVSVGALGAANIMGELRKGTIRILSVLSDKRLEGSLSNIPTAKELGFNVTFPMWRGFYAPAGVGTEVVKYWSGVLTRLSKTKTWQKILKDLSWFPFLVTGREFASFLEEDTNKYKAIVGGS